MEGKTARVNQLSSSRRITAQPPVRYERDIHCAAAAARFCFIVLTWAVLTLRFAISVAV